jgi:rhodanese-related sulfurtransferase
LVAAVLLCFVSACQRAQLAEYKPYANDSEVPRISVEDAKKDYDSGVAVIIDSRPDAAYAQEHVVGSINIPSGSPDTEFSKIPQGKKIIVYCS